VSKKIEGLRIHIRVTASQYEKLRKVAEKGGYSISETLRRAIDEFLKSAK
jgi:hypothetical protein